jgi:hypothetical protein
MSGAFSKEVSPAQSRDEPDEFGITDAMVDAGVTFLWESGRWDDQPMDEVIVHDLIREILDASPDRQKKPKPPEQVLQKTL